jgi:hypothetical protein
VQQGWTHHTGVLGQLVDEADRLHHGVAQLDVSKALGVGVFQLKCELLREPSTYH